jgi:hypothetical protein
MGRSPSLHVFTFCRSNLLIYLALPEELPEISKRGPCPPVQSISAVLEPQLRASRRTVEIVQPVAGNSPVNTVRLEEYVVPTESVGQSKVFPNSGVGASAKATRFVAGPRTSSYSFQFMCQFSESVSLGANWWRTFLVAVLGSSRPHRSVTPYMRTGDKTGEVAHTFRENFQDIRKHI